MLNLIVNRELILESRELNSIIWKNQIVAEYCFDKGKYYVMPVAPNYTSAEGWFDTEIEALEYILELIKVHNE